MNGEQLENWLIELKERWKKYDTTSDGRSAVRQLNYECTLLNREKDRTQFLISYLSCNYADVDLAQPILAQLLACYYRQGLLRYFILQCLPSLIHLYLSALAKRQRKSISMLEAFIIPIYNEEILAGGAGSNSLSKKVEEVRIPSVRYPSVYHDPKKFNLPFELTPIKPGSPAFIQMMVKIGPFDTVEKITPENRQTVLTRLLRSVNGCLCRLSKDVICRYMCLNIVAICHSGFSFPKSILRSRLFGSDSSEITDDFAKKHRLKVSSQYLLEAVNGIYFTLFNGYPELAVEALDAIHQRALYEFYANVTLVTNSIRASLLEGGISKKDESLFIAKSSPSKFDGRRRSEMITNASLRLKKMPEDIALVVDPDNKGSLFTERVENLKKKWVSNQHRFKHLRHRRKSENNANESTSDIELDQISEEDQTTDAVVEHLARLSATSPTSDSTHLTSKISTSDETRNSVNGAAKVVNSGNDALPGTMGFIHSVIIRDELPDSSVTHPGIRHMDSVGDIADS